MTGVSRQFTMMIGLAVILVVPTASAGVELEKIGAFDTGLGDGAVEIVAYHAGSARAFVVNSANMTVDIVDLGDPTSPVLFGAIDATSYGDGANSVAVNRDGLVAVAIQADPKQDPGLIVFFDLDGNPVSTAPAGALPEMVAYTPCGTLLIVANEGEPDDSYQIDPEGTVTLVDVSDPASPVSTQLDFSDFNAGGPRADDLPEGVRIFGPNASVAQDLEPESVSVVDCGGEAFVTLQENNAVAVIDLDGARVDRIYALGAKDFSMPDNKIDASDRDDGINIQNWPVMSFYQPDAIAVYHVNGVPFFLTANKGDARDYDGYSEEVRVEDLILDPAVFQDILTLQLEENLGRLKTTTANGDADGDGLFQQIYGFGGRSFSIWNGRTGRQVWDSAGQFEAITAQLVPDIFNSQGDPDSFDSRSDDKGPEPEAVVVGRVAGTSYAFVGLESVGGVMVYDVTQPAAPIFVSYEPGTDGDIAPEGLAFVSAAQSPNGAPLLLVAHKVSGTLTVYEVREASSSGFTSYLEIAAHNHGVNGSVWRTDLIVKKSTSVEANVDITFFGEGAPAAMSLVIDSSQAAFEDVVAVVGGVGTGFVKIVSDQALSIQGRIYSLSDTGTFGQFVQGFSVMDGLMAGESVQLLGLRQQTEAYRSNISYTNPLGADAVVGVTLFDAAGAALVSYTVDLPPWSVVHDLEPFADRALRTDVGWGYAEVTLTSGVGVFTSASVIDAGTNDATTIPATPF